MASVPAFRFACAMIFAALLPMAALSQQKPLVGPPSMLRLLNGGLQDGMGRAGVEIKLQADYKTYWRTPGDSGVPPRFDWSRSSNVKSVTLSYPVPSRFDDSAGSSIGYNDEVIFPLVVEAQDASRPVELHLVLDYAVCSTICIPVHDEAKLRLTPGTRATALTAARLEDYAMRVPTTTKVGDPGPLTVTTIQTASPDAVVIEARAPAGATIVDVFVEGPDGWTFGAAVPTVAREVGGEKQIAWRVSVEDRPGKDTPLVGLPVTVTLAADDRAVEITLPLDGAARLR